MIHPAAPALRLLADDLTGALDTAAELSALYGPVRVLWDGSATATSQPGSIALDSGTRETERDVASARVTSLAPALAGPGIAYKKVDSLLRGHVAAELAACLRLGAWHHCVFAPAFPAQGRITRGGRLLVRQPDGDLSPARGDLLAMLAAEGLPARPGSFDAPLPPGVAVFDAETEDDLARVAALGRQAQGPVLWCGSGGLARALAGEARARPSTALQRPVLGLFGSDQAVTARQLAACGPCWIRLVEGGGAEAAARVARQMETAGVALASLDLPPGLARGEAARRIEAAFTDLAHRLPRPGTLLAAGGETLRALCRGLGARSLETTGVVAPGVPRSVMRGGGWDGLEVVSKSGAFGTDMLWRDLLAQNGLPIGSIDE
jgi:D-threonate/D-erythronate kinase